MSALRSSPVSPFVQVEFDVHGLRRISAGIALNIQVPLSYPKAAPRAAFHQAKA